MKEKFNFDGTLKAAAVQYRGVYRNTILDWQPDETHGYPEGTNIYIKEKEQWVPYTGIFFKEEHFLYKGREVSFAEIKTFLQNEEITKITIYQIIKNKKLIGYVNQQKKSIICY